MKVCPCHAFGVSAVLISVCVAAAPVVDQDDEISKTLKHIGVNYTHRNESLIAENVVEKERIKVLLEASTNSLHPSTQVRQLSAQEKRKAGRKSKSKHDGGGKEKSPAPQWPPRRKHHKPPPGPAEKYASLRVTSSPYSPRFFRLMSRSRALVDLGMMASPDDIHAFAQDLYVASYTSDASEYNCVDTFGCSIRKTTDEQNEMLAKLDRHARKSGW